MFSCDCVYLSMWAAECVARRELIKAGCKSQKRQRRSDQLGWSEQSNTWQTDGWMNKEKHTGNSWDLNCVRFPVMRERERDAVASESVNSDTGLALVPQ